MSKIFLTSSVHAVAHDIAKRVDLSAGKLLVFIDTAAEVKDRGEWVDNDRNALVNAGFEVTDYTITDKTREQLERDLGSYDFFYLEGGDSLHLAQQSWKSGFDSLIRELILDKGKTYIGTSAGSVMAGPAIPDYWFAPKEVPPVEDRLGYGLVNFTVIPHWGSEHFREKHLKLRLPAGYHEQQVPLIILTDNQYVWAHDSGMEIIDVSKI